MSATRQTGMSALRILVTPAPVFPHRKGGSASRPYPKQTKASFWQNG
jgi:hypothetical protein